MVKKVMDMTDDELLEELAQIRLCQSNHKKQSADCAEKESDIETALQRRQEFRINARFEELRNMQGGD